MLLIVPPRDAVGNTEGLPATSAARTYARSNVHIMMQLLFGLLHDIIHNLLFADISGRKTLSNLMPFVDAIETKLAITTEAISAALEGINMLRFVGRQILNFHPLQHPIIQGKEWDCHATTVLALSTSYDPSASSVGL